MEKSDCSEARRRAERHVCYLLKSYADLGLSTEEMRAAVLSRDPPRKNNKTWLLVAAVTVLLASVSYQYSIPSQIFNYVVGVRCLIPNNYFVWEATRPVSDCHFCSNVTRALVLPNVTREEFAPYAYSSKPIVIRGAFLHWPALKTFDLQYFKALYASVPDSHRSVDEECQFLHFKSDFISLKDVFDMSQSRVDNLEGERSWGNCHPDILEEMRTQYPKPHFLPLDAELPYKDYVFMGYDDGATMHLDYINRLMWQAQLRGSKRWKLLPPPECQSVCEGVEFTVVPGDAVLVDTRVWYHSTKIAPGEFSLSVQSEYG
ncbi:uncharacterized protein LOC132707387 isoform X2 [Cylas formicarius]|uniref:uncharacterized protein LOC132707387 isoform X2 n=1 Tax=Cylas formicarius TaxID=197179 RepID=UPI002958C223|nr:uncharacterized protein LOC132707387 isoform X2 [Cylas formicarius]